MIHNNLIGNTYGRLYVKELYDIGKYRQARWLCKCECGNTKIATSEYFRKVKIPSCGCANRRLNTYIKCTGYYYIELPNKCYAKVSECDVGKIKCYTWYLDHRGYIITRVRENGKQRLIYLHRLIMDVHNEDFIPGLTSQVDHISRDKLDCRRENLRFASIQENNCNTGSKNKFGYKGVSKHRNTFIARITCNHKVIYIGSFPTAKEAAIAYNKAAIQYHGQYASLNIIKEERN